MTDLPGIIPYDLATGNFCGECGRAKLNRLFLDTLSGCSECDGVITRHRCTLPQDLAVGQQWQCPLCDSTWTAREQVEACLDCCGECGHEVPVRKWDYAEGARAASAPKRVPQGPYTPFRNRLGKA